MRRLSVFALSVCLFSAAMELKAQIYRTSDQYIQNIKVTYGGRELPSAWAGGFSNPRFAIADIDHDGKDEAVILEPYTGLRTFKNISGPGETKYIYSPNMEYLLPDAKRYLKMLDYNGDNIPDMIHFGNYGLEICDGFYNSANLLAYKNCREIKYTYGPFSGLLYVAFNSGDIPAIVDVDGDGDVDVLSYSQYDNDLVWYYKNMCKEENLPAETFKLKIKSECWGKVQTGYAVNRQHTLGINCMNQGMNGGSQEKTTGTGAHAFTLLHLDGDGDYDMLDGYKDYADVQMMKNGKADINYPVDSMITQDTMWAPNGVKIDMPKFPITFWLDMDHDGDSDLVVTPLAPGTEDVKCVAYYRNDGTPGAPSFNYQNDSFLINEILDFGSDSRPVVYDYDKDGKKDMIVGATRYDRGTGGRIPQLVLLKNTTAGGKLSFDLVQTNLLNINTSGFDGVAPAIGDLDNDGLDDLVIGRRDGKLTFYKNNAINNTVQPVWVSSGQNMTTKFGTTIQLNEYATPCIYDIDKDGKKDLVVGSSKGFLSYFHNEGAVPHEMKLVQETDKLGDVFVGITQSGMPYDGYSAPFIGRIDNTPQEYLLVGNNMGVIAKYSGVDNGYNNNAPYTRVDSAYSRIQIKGTYSSPVVGNLDGDTTMLEMFIGNSHGGLFAYQQIFKESVNDLSAATAFKLKLYPNPAQNELQLRIEGNNNLPADAMISIYNNAGQRMKGFDIIRNKNTVTVNIENLQQGVYLCTMLVNGENYTHVFVKK